ncbi:hypothetical protein [Streptacidiphilus carbonis]|jgi:hypothetical protein|uniref:hypothetical protein n=1 Tax=Streptacidiphilus carbonis TaxID=105422 RepID=UPI0005A5F2A2|nr:hypothetical protein [Streptacidiphilus carbonis]
MTTRRRRDHQAERAALQAAADRLLHGTALRSETGRLTVTELLHESGLRRDVVYGHHKDLVEEFQAQVQALAQQHMPSTADSLAEENSRLQEKLTETTSALAEEREVTAALRRLITELDLELQAARGATGPTRVTGLPARRRPVRER